MVLIALLLLDHAIAIFQSLMNEDQESHKNSAWYDDSSTSKFSLAPAITKSGIV